MQRRSTLGTDLGLEAVLNDSDVDLDERRGYRREEKLPRGRCHAHCRAVAPNVGVNTPI